MTATPELSGQLGRYIIVRKLGSGGMGAVYLAEDTQLGRKVALKVPLLGEDPVAVERFRREARLAATIDHPNLCPVFDVGETRGILYFTMPFIEGTPLSKLVGKGSPWEVPQAIELMRKVSAAVAHLHNCGIIHRDLKPGNIMVRGSGDPVLMDFGLARMYEAQTQHLTGTGVPLGSPAYMAPEQIQGAHDSSPPTDVYGLAMILYQLVAGRLPFEGPLQTLYYLILSTPPAPPSQFNPGLDPRLDALILRALSKRAEDRGYTAESFGQALAGVLTQPQVVSKPPLQHTDSTRGGGATQPSRAQPPLSQVATILPGQAPAPAAIPVAPPRPPMQPPRQEVRRATIPRGQWYLRVRGTVTGPFTGEQLYQKYTRSEVGRFHEASTDQLNWGSVAAVLGLQPGPAQPEPPPVKNEYEQTMMVSAEEVGLVSSGSGRRSSNGLDQLLLAAILRTGATFLAGTGLFLALALREMPVLGVSVIVGVVLVLYAGVVRFWGLHLGKHLPARVNLARYGPLMEILAGVTVALTALYALVLILAEAFTKPTPTDAIKVGLTGGLGLLLVLAVLPDVARTVLHLLVMRAALAPLPNGSRHVFVMLVSFAALVVVGLGLYLTVLTSLLSSDRIPGGVAPLVLLLLLASVVWQVCVTVLTYRMKGLLGSA